MFRTVLALSFAALMLGSAGAQQLRETTIEVIVESDLKLDGESWDFGFSGAPDVFVCLGDSQGQRCILRNAGAKPGDGDAWCNNLAIGDSCLIAGVVIKDEQVQVQVFDKDLLEDDPIGAGTCMTDGTICQLGLTTVRFY